MTRVYNIVSVIFTLLSLGVIVYVVFRLIAG